MYYNMFYDMQELTLHSQQTVVVYPFMILLVGTLPTVNLVVWTQTALWRIIQCT